MGKSMFVLMSEIAKEMMSGDLERFLVESLAFRCEIGVRGK